MKKSAFSYLELIICMSLVTAVVMLSMPLSTQNQATSDIYGEFRCFSEYHQTFQEYRLYQQQRFNSSALSERRDVTDTGCVFTRPAGVNTFTITAIGGGGGGSRPVSPNSDLTKEINQIVDTQISGGNVRRNLNASTINNLYNNISSSEQYRISSCNSSSCEYTGPSTNGARDFVAKVNRYVNKQMQRAISLYPGAGGEQGEIVTRTSSLANNFTNNEIVIHLCRNAEIPNGTISEHDYCVGRGGEGGIGQDLKSYYTLIGVIQDLAKYRNNNSNFGNYGNSSLFGNLTLIRTATRNNSTNTEAYRNYQLFLNNPTNLTRFNNALSSLTAFARSINNLETDMFSSHGHNGQYSRFKINNNENLIAQGGKGGSTKTGIEYIFKNSTNPEHVISGNFYTRRGEMGKFDDKITGGSGGIGGNCTCQGNSCQNCNGLAGTRIGSGGGGGSIVYNTNQNLRSHNAVSFITTNNAVLNSQYDIKNNSTTINELRTATSIDAVNNNTFFAGNGGNGAGGAIIINW